MSFCPSNSASVAEFLAGLKSGCEESLCCDTSILVAVSGGADSVALLRGLLLLREPLGLTLHVGHLNHLLRGEASISDADWVREISRQFGLTCHVGSRSVMEMPEISRHGLEGTARLARRQFLQHIARQNACSRIALAHTADDQVETILHHILRGTGLGGLAGMQACDSGQSRDPETIPFARPMLSINRQQVERFLEELHQDFRTDATNQDTQLTRNRIRHELLPLLERDFNPQVRQALLRLGRQARDIHTDACDAAERLLNAVLLESSPQVCRLLCEPFEHESANCIRECLVRLWRRQDWPRQHMGFRDWNRLVELLRQTAGTINLPGKIHARRKAGLLLLTRQTF